MMTNVLFVSMWNRANGQQDVMPRFAWNSQLHDLLIETVFMSKNDANRLQLSVLKWCLLLPV